MPEKWFFCCFSLNYRLCQEKNHKGCIHEELTDWILDSDEKLWINISLWGKVCHQSVPRCKKTNLCDLRQNIVQLGTELLLKATWYFYICSIAASVVIALWQFIDFQEHFFHQHPISSFKIKHFPVTHIPKSISPIALSQHLLFSFSNKLILHMPFWSTDHAKFFESFKDTFQECERNWNSSSESKEEK